MPAGRPTEYREEYNEQATRLCLLGSTDEQLAEAFEVHVDTIYNWKNAHPRFVEAIKKGKLKADCDVAESLYNKALAGDTTAMIFWLKNRSRREWRDRHEVENIAPESRLTEAELQAKIDELQRSK